MASQTPVQGKPAAPSHLAPASKKAGMSPLSAQQKRKGPWMKWVLLILITVFALTYLLGRVVEPVRARVSAVPVVGSLLFAKPVWPVLWNKRAAPAASTNTPSGSQTQTSGTTAAGASTPDFSRQEAEIAGRLAAAEVKENDLKRREADLSAKEAALKKREGTISQQEIQLGQELKSAQALRAQLDGQLRARKDRAEIIRNMRSTGVQQLFGAMTDDEVLQVLMYMDAAEVGKYLSGMDPYRSARLLQALREVAPAASTTP